MLIFTTQAKVAIVLTLLVVWAYNNYKYHHPPHKPLIKTNVITYQNDHRNISRPWDNFDAARNLYAKQKSKAKKAKKAR